MRRATPIIVALLAALPLAGCGDDEDNDFDLPKLSPAEVYRSNMSAQCQDAKERQRDLKAPVGGSSGELADYLSKVLALEKDLRSRLDAFTPPNDLAAGVRKALAEEEKLASIVGSYMRAARGGRPFETVLAQLENALNPQIRETNRAFGAVDIAGCQGEELDLGYANQD